MHNDTPNMYWTLNVSILQIISENVLRPDENTQSFMALSITANASFSCHYMGRGWGVD